MTILTRPQAEALATFIVRVREDWSHTGVMAALEKSNIVDALDTARALINLAATPTAKTPALLAKPGPWWRDPTGQNMAPERHTMQCHEHPTHTVPCRECTDRALADPPRPETIAAAKAAAQRARNTR